MIAPAFPDILTLPNYRNIH